MRRQMPSAPTNVIASLALTFRQNKTKPAVASQAKNPLLVHVLSETGTGGANIMMTLTSTRSKSEVKKFS